MNPRQGQAVRLAVVRARAAELQATIDGAPDEAAARQAADELHALLDAVVATEQQPERARAVSGHPGWCSQDCPRPTTARDGTVEWSHDRRVDVDHLDGTADVFVVRMDALAPDGHHGVTEAVVLTAAGSFTARQAEAFALHILGAVHLLDAGLDGTPGGVPAVLELLPSPRPTPAAAAGSTSGAVA